MKVILIENIDNLGKAGDTKEVRPGFARNFLFPKGLALSATSSNLKIVEKKKREEELEREQQKQEANELAKKIAQTSCTIIKPAGEDDKLFGAVTNADIAEALKQEGIIIDKRNIVIESPIHNLGIYSVKVKLHPEVTQELKVWVIKE